MPPLAPPSWLDVLQDELNALEDQALRRRLRPVSPRGRVIDLHGRSLINLAANDYLGLASHPHLREAAIEAIRTHGVGAGAARLITGHTPLHEVVEARFAAFKHAEAALILPTGYMANLAVLTALARPGDLVCMDKLNHASLIDAGRASGATVRVYPHGGLEKLERLLRQHADATAGSQTGDRPRAFIVTDSIFSMDGDPADLPALCDLAERYDAMLIVDEAHGTGVLGDTGAGLAEAQGVAERVHVVVSTASKALGGLGGIITGPRIVIETIINRARPFIFTTAAPPAQVAAIDAALDVLRDEPWRRHRVIELARRLRESLGLPGLQSEIITPIIPIIEGPAPAAQALAAHLEAHGFYAPAIRPPTVSPNASRVRITLRADLEDADVDRLIACLADWRTKRADTVAKP